MLDRSLFGANPSGAHAINIALHSATAALLFLFLARVAAATWRSAFVAAVFAIHPLRAESVAWIAERKDVLSGFFFVLTLIGYARFVRTRSLGNYLLAAAALAAGLMSKPMLVTTPCVLLLLDFWPLRRTAHEKLSRLAGEKIPLLALCAASVAATLFAQRGAVAGSDIPLIQRLANAPLACVAYLRQTAWPHDLSVLYLHEPAGPFRVVAATLALLAITATSIALRRRSPSFLVGWLWFIGMLVPVIGIVQVGMQAHADRYTYLPSIGLLIALTWLIAFLFKRFAIPPVAAATLGLALLAAFSACTYRQVGYWRNADTLWSHALAVDPQNDAAHLAYAEALFAEQRSTEAIADLRKAVELRPSNAGRYGGGVLGLDEQQLDAGIAFWAQRIEEHPQDAGAKDSLGALLIQQHRTREAIALWEEALALDPNDGNAQNNLAWVFATSPDESVRNAPRALDLAQRAFQLAGGRNAIVARTLCAALAENGRFDEATATATRARDVAREEGNQSLANDLEGAVRQFEAHQPLRDAAMQPARDLR